MENGEINNAVSVQDFKWAEMIMLLGIKSVIKETNGLKWIERHHVENDVELIFIHSHQVKVSQCLSSFFSLLRRHCITVMASWKSTGVDLSLN